MARKILKISSVLVLVMILIFSILVAMKLVKNGRKGNVQETETEETSEVGFYNATDDGRALVRNLNSEEMSKEDVLGSIRYYGGVVSDEFISELYSLYGVELSSITKIEVDADDLSDKDYLEVHDYDNLDFKSTSVERCVFINSLRVVGLLDDCILLLQYIGGGEPMYIVYDYSDVLYTVENIGLYSCGDIVNVVVDKENTIVKEIEGVIVLITKG